MLNGVKRRPLLGLVVLAALVIVTVVYVRVWLGRLAYPLRYKETIAAEGRRNRVDPFLISAIIFEESKFDPRSKSSAGALGLMQVMPETGKWVAAKRDRTYRPQDLLDPGENIATGSWYFRFLLSRYRDERLALAAYNSGHKNLDRWLSERGRAGKTLTGDMVREIPFPETRNFVRRVEETRAVYRRLYPRAFESGWDVR